MEGSAFLTEFLLVLVVATFVAVVFERFKLPSILGFLLAGVAVGPHGFGWLTDIGKIHQLAEVGVVLLMLTIGLEFSFDRLRGLKYMAIIGGGLQILLSIGICLLFAWWKGWSMYRGIFLGSVIALSSTAIVLKYLMDRGELDTHHGRIALAILLFQDLAVIPLMIFLGGSNGSGAFWGALGSAFLKVFLLLGGVIVGARYLLPALLRWMALKRNREVFFLTSVVICLGTAWFSEKIGLSYAVGAFSAGVMFANTDYGHQLLGEIAPLRHIFVSLFFVSIGILFNLGFAIEHIWTILRLVGLVMLVNFVLMTILIMAFRYPPRIALAAGLILSQIGEFSFLLMQVARSSGKIEPQFYDLLLSVAFMSMLITPFLFALVPYVLRFSEKQSLFGMRPKERKMAREELSDLDNHVILSGYGPTGQDLAHSFKEENIPFVLVDMNPSRVKEAKSAGIPVIYGDAANVEVMRRAGIEKARQVVVSFGDSIGMNQIIRVVERLNPKVKLVVRTRFERDVAQLYELGADDVIMEEWEAGYEMHRTVLENLKIDPDRIRRHLERVVQRKEILVEEAIFSQIRKEKD